VFFFSLYYALFFKYFVARRHGLVIKVSVYDSDSLGSSSGTLKYENNSVTDP